MLSKLKEKFGGVAIGALVASLAVAGAIAMPATAQQAVGGPVANASQGLVKYIKRSLQIGRVANRRSVQAIRSARAANQRAGRPGPEGPTGPQGPPGADGDDLSDGAVTTDKLDDGAVDGSKLADGAVSASKLGGTVRRSSSGSVPAGDGATITTTCEPGEVPLSGGGTWQFKISPGPVIDFPPQDLVHIHRSFPAADNESWTMGVYNGDAEAWTFTTYVLCLQA